MTRSLSTVVCLLLVNLHPARLHAFDTEWYNSYGGTDWDALVAVTLDDVGRSYLVGCTTSPDFPLISAFDSVLEGIQPDAFILHIDADGTPLWSTLIGGITSDVARCVAVAPNGDVVVGGFTNGDFPTLNTTDSVHLGEVDGFLTRFSNTGTLLWSRYFGHSGRDLIYDLCIDQEGFVYITGDTSSKLMLAKIAPNGATVWELVPSNCDSEGAAIEIDQVGNLYVCGRAEEGFTLKSAWQPYFGGGLDMVVLSASADGQLRWSTYMGGGGLDVGNDLAVGRDSSLYLVGATEGQFPTPNGWDSSPNGRFDGFVACMTSSGDVTWATYVGGAFDDELLDVLAPRGSSLTVAGITESGDFPFLGGGPTLSVDRIVIGELIDGAIIASSVVTGEPDWNRLSGADFGVSGNAWDEMVVAWSDRGSRSDIHVRKGKVDEDDDGLPDGWEIAHNLDPQDSGGDSGPDGDPDGDGISNKDEYHAGTDPRIDDVDSDGDGLRNGWERQYGLDPYSNLGDDGAEGDPDHDGWSNAEEQGSGSDPRVLDMQILKAVEVRWHTAIGRRYQLYRSENLQTWLPVGQPIVGNGDYFEILESTREQDSRFYRVEPIDE